MIGYDYRDSIFVAGIGRSGTTWLSDLINYDKQYRILFEPLHPQHGIELRHTLTNATYLRPDHTDADLKHGLISLMSGEMINDYVDQDNKDDSGTRFLMKEIRLNTMLPWIHANLPGMPIVYILRHPGAVIASQMRLEWKASQKNLNHLLAQEALIEDYLAPFEALMRKAKNDFEYRLYFWCANNYVVFNHFKNGEICRVTYEDLKRNPQDEMHRIFAYLNRSFNADALASLVNRPSRTTWNTPNQTHWTQFLDSSQQALMWETLEIFGLDAIYSKEKTSELAQSRSFTKLMPDAPKPSAGQRIKSKLKQMLKNITTQQG